MSTEAPVALLHSYLSDRKNNSKPDRLTRTGILAAAELYRHGEISKICITVEPQLSGPQTRRLRSILPGIPQNDLIVEAKTVTTRDEIAIFRELAKQRGWINLITIGNEAHIPRIKREIERGFNGTNIDIKARSAKELLGRYPRYSSIVNEMSNWPEEKSLTFQETILNIPILGNLLLRVAPHLSHLKVVLQSWSLRQLEK